MAAAGVSCYNTKRRAGNTETAHPAPGAPAEERGGGTMIYLLEDDESIRKLVTYTLEREGYDARGFGTPSEFWQAMDGARPELVLLDIMLPEEDGLSVLKKLRATPRTAKLPVIMLTAKGTEYDKVVGLDGGADDYVAKPFGMMELLSRIRALLRRTETENGTLRCGILEVDPGQHIVRVRGQETILTQKEFEVLCLLLRNPGQVLSREQLIENVWGYAFTGESRTVDVHVRTLRQKLGEAGAYIETVRGYGYKISPVN